MGSAPPPRRHANPPLNAHQQTRTITNPKRRINPNQTVNATEELARADAYPLIRVTSGPLQGKLRLNEIPPGPSKERLAVDLPWSVANASTIGGVGGGGGWDFFSALCWFSLRDTFDANKAAGAIIPLGGVVECYGGTSIQYWSSADALAACPLAATNPGTACCGYGGNNSCLYNAQVAPYTIGPTRFAAALWMQCVSDAPRPARAPAFTPPPPPTHTHTHVHTLHFPPPGASKTPIAAAPPRSPTTRAPSPR